MAKKILGEIVFLRQLAVGSWQLAGGSWQVSGGMCLNCLGAVRKAGNMCLHQLVVGGTKRGGAAGAGGAAVLSTFYVLMTNCHLPSLTITDHH